jgi:O-antigen/teichoic acid export membrane protein
MSVKPPGNAAQDTPQSAALSTAQIEAEASKTPSVQSEPLGAESSSRSLGRTIFRNSIFVSSGGGVVRLLGFAFTILVVRLLGEDAYGQYLTALAFTGLLGIFFELGTTQYVERSLAQDRTRLPQMLWKLLVIRLLLSFASVLIIPGLAIALGYDRVVIIAILLQTLTFILAALLAPLVVLMSSHERYDLWTANQIVGQLGTILLGATVLWLGGGLLHLVAVGLLVMPIQIAFSMIVLRRSGLGPLHWVADVAGVRAFLRASLPFALTALALTVSFNIDTVLLSLMQPSNVVGWYGAAYRLVPTVVSLLGGFLAVITPSLARTYVQDRAAVSDWTRTGTKWLAMFGLASAAGISLLAGPIVLLLYGAAFAPSAVVLAIIAWDIPLRLFNAFAGNVTAAVGLEQKAWRIFMTGTTVGVILYVPAIWFFGMIGAAVITVLSDAINSTRFFILLSKELQAGRVGVLLRTVAAVAIMGAVVWAVSHSVPLVAAVLIGAATFGLATLALGLVNRETIMRVVGFLQPGRQTP